MADDVLAQATEHTFDPEDRRRDDAALGRLFATTTTELRGTATPETIRNFANSYGDDNPLFCDPDHGRQTRWNGQVAPQIMAAVLGARLHGDRPSRALRGGSYRGIHSFVSGGEWEWFAPVRPGDTLYSFEGLDSVEEKASAFAGRTLIRRIRYVKMNQRAEVVGVYRAVVVFAERKAARKAGSQKEIPPTRWTPEALAELDAIYDAETARGREPRWWEDVEVGQPMPQMAKGPLRTTDIIACHVGGYGQVPFGLWTGRLDRRNRERIPNFYVANDDGVPDVAQRVHWDDDWATAIGARRSYDYGVLRECWMHHYLTDWMGDDAWVVSQHDTMRKFNYHGDAQVLTGAVVDKHRVGDDRIVDVEVTMTNQRDEVTLTGVAAIALPSRETGLPVPAAAPEDLRRMAQQMLLRHVEITQRGSEPVTIEE